VIIRMRPVLEDALGQTRLGEFLIALIDPDAADAQQLIYKNYPGTAERVTRPDWPFAERDIHFADQTWNLTLAPAEGSSLAPESPPYWIFGAGLLFSLFAAYSISASIAIGGLRKQVEARSEALKAMRLGQYTLLEKIWEGGVGVVYKAKHAMLRRPTAVKMLRPDKVTDEDIARFEREVQATSQLAHPNTVEIYDYGRTPEGVFYYAMEYLEGLTLAGLIELEGAVPASRVIHILKQVCGSLSEAHAAGLIHRDIKPLNIFLCERGGVADVVKVLDFGLVKNIVSSGMTQLTSADVIGGTPGYIAPERLRDPLHIDARADIYSLGCVAFNLLTGQPLFMGATPMEICHQAMTESPARPSERVADKGTIPLELDDLVVACLARDPDERPRDIEAVLDTLNALAEGSPWSQEEARTWWRNRDTQMESEREKVGLEEAKRAEATTITMEIKPRG